MLYFVQMAIRIISVLLEKLITIKLSYEMLKKWNEIKETMDDWMN